MQFTVQLVALAGLLHLANIAFAEGINCEGSTFCDMVLSNNMEEMTQVIQSSSFDTSRFYNNGEQIICGSNVCAFCQKSDGAPGTSIVTLMQDLTDHGCKSCGSIPLFFPQGDNNVADGELTVNFVSNACTVGTEVTSPAGDLFVLCQ